MDYSKLDINKIVDPERIGFRRVHEFSGEKPENKELRAGPISNVKPNS